MGCNHFDYKPTIKNNSFDVTFVGMAHGNRKKNRLSKKLMKSYAGETDGK